jgi:hypothetical protein
MPARRPPWCCWASGCRTDSVIASEEPVGWVRRSAQREALSRTRRNPPLLLPRKEKWWVTPSTLARWTTERLTRLTHPTIATSDFIPAAPMRPGFAISTSSESRGRRECRVLNCTRSLVGSKGSRPTSIVTTGTGRTSALPAQWFYGLLRALPGVPGLLASIADRSSRSA